jgi:3-oxoacyl-[acyl-carrier-protein] synthase II
MNDKAIAITDYYAAFADVEWTPRGESTLRAAFEKEGSGNSRFANDDLRTAVLARHSSLITHHSSLRTAVCFSSSKSRWMRGRAAFAFDDGRCEPAAQIAAALGARGPALSPVAACATGAHAIATGAQLILDGHADCVLAGAEEIGLPPLVRAAYDRLGALSPQKIMRPFDRRRDGFVPAEGFGWLMLEDAENARARGAAIYGHVAGWSLSGDPHSMTAMTPGGEAIAHAIKNALKRAGAPRVDYINAHGTATKLNDAVETRGIRLALGGSTPVSATKPLTGHLLGAAGAVEAVLCLRAMRENYAPPTLNLEAADAECDLDYIPLRGRTLPIKCALSLSYGFGGHIGVLVLTAAL